MNIFHSFEIKSVYRWGDSAEQFGQTPGKAMAANFTLNGMNFLALNGGPPFKFDESVSFQIHCDTHEEIDQYWNQQTDGGEESMCGWLKGRFGLSWQVVPSQLGALMSNPAESGSL